MYIEKNLSYSPSNVKGLVNNSLTPSLLIRNNLRNIDKVSPYNHNSKTRNIYAHNYVIGNGSHQSNRHHNEDNYVGEDNITINRNGYSPYKKYTIRKK